MCEYNSFKQQISGLKEWVGIPHPDTRTLAKMCYQMGKKNPPSTGTAISSAFASHHFLYCSKSDAALTFTRSLKGLRHQPPNSLSFGANMIIPKDTLSLSSHLRTLSAVPLVPLLHRHSLMLTTEPIPAVTPCPSACRPLNYRDANIIRNTNPWSVLSTGIPWSDCAGCVIAVGENVTRLIVGHRVSPRSRA